MNLGRWFGNHRGARKNHPKIAENCAFGHRSPINLYEQNVDWLAAFVGREYNGDPFRSLMSPYFCLSDC